MTTMPERNDLMTKPIQKAPLSPLGKTTCIDCGANNLDLSGNNLLNATLLSD